MLAVILFQIFVRLTVLSLSKQTLAYRRLCPGLCGTHHFVRATGHSHLHHHTASSPPMATPPHRKGPKEKEDANAKPQVTPRKQNQVPYGSFVTENSKLIWPVLPGKHLVSWLAHLSFSELYETWNPRLREWLPNHKLQWQKMSITTKSFLLSLTHTHTNSLTQRKREYILKRNLKKIKYA